MKPTVLLTIFFFSGCLISCYSYPSVPDQYYIQDFYFEGSGIQIVGKADLPSSISTVYRDGKATREFIPFQKRAEVCEQEAVHNAHSKWMALTMENVATQTEWSRRLKAGANGDYTSCHENAEKVRILFEYPDGCAVVMQYPCDPHDY